MTHGDPASLTLFNIVLDAVVSLVLLEFCGLQEAHHGLGWAAGEHNIVFYADGIRIADHNRIWLQAILTEVVRMYDRVVL